MKELVVVSGKGGTGKTSITAAFAALTRTAVIADGDVDAANLHLILGPTVRESHDFASGSTAKLDPELCTNCGLCEAECRFGAIFPPGGAEDAPSYRIDPILCEGCGVCVRVCPEKAIRLEEETCGQWFRSETRFGPMIHAELFPGQENSGKLVSLVRQEARVTAKKTGAGLILVDGPPGVGCPVIAALTGADYAVTVSEPTVSGIEDLKRVSSLIRHFGIRAGVVVNKADLNPAAAARIEKFAAAGEFDVLGRVPYDPSVTRAQVEGRTLLEAGSEQVVRAVRQIWQKIIQSVEQRRTPFAIGL